MELSRRDLFKIGGKILVLASTGATLRQLMGAAPAPEVYRRADHWWGMIIDIEGKEEMRGLVLDFVS